MPPHLAPDAARPTPDPPGAGTASHPSVPGTRSDPSDPGTCSDASVPGTRIGRRDGAAWPTRTGPVPDAGRLRTRVRATLVRRDRDRLADAVAALLDAARTAPGPHAGAGVETRDQVLLGGPVLRDVEHLLRGDDLLDTRGVHLVAALLDDVREHRTAPGDPLCVDEAARAARRALHPHGQHVADGRRRTAGAAEPTAAGVAGGRARAVAS